MLVGASRRIGFTMRLLQLLILLGSVLIGVNGQVTDVPTGLDSTDSPTETSPFSIDAETTKILVTGDPGFDEERGCFLNTTLVDAAVRSFGHFVQKRAVLCADTTFDIEFMADFKPFSRTEYFCGDDGKSSNNCFVMNGQFHIVAFSGLVDGGRNDNVLFQGITFGNVGQTHNLLNNRGHITFRDCIWKESTVQSCTVVGYSIDEGNDDEPLETRRLSVSFFNCRFERISILSDSDYESNQLILLDRSANDLVVDNCTFIGNRLNVDIVDTGIAIYVNEGASLRLTNTCFIDNDFKGKGTIFVSDNKNITAENNYINDPSSELGCKFLYDNRTATCTDADLSSCPREASLPAPATPSQSPENSTDLEGTSSDNVSENDGKESNAKGKSRGLGLFLSSSMLVYFVAL